MEPRETGAAGPATAMSPDPDMQEKKLPSHGEARRDQALAYGETFQEQARRWIEANQTLALLGGFALGVFMGVWMRDG